MKVVMLWFNYIFIFLSKMSEAPLKTGSGQPEQRAKPKNPLRQIIGQRKPIQLPSFKVASKTTQLRMKADHDAFLSFSLSLSCTPCRLKGKKRLSPAPQRLQKTHITPHLTQRHNSHSDNTGKSLVEVG